MLSEFGLRRRSVRGTYALLRHTDKQHALVAAPAAQIAGKSGLSSWTVGVDTSVMVAAVHANHPMHSAAARWLDAALGSHTVVVAHHSVLEAYAVLTRLPSPNQGIVHRGADSTP